MSAGERKEAEIVVLTSPSFTELCRALIALGLIRDSDRTEVRTTIDGEPSFASWSRDEGEDGEVDYHYDEHAGTRWLEVRGEDAAKHAAEIAAMLGGTRKGTAEDMLVDLMTPPRRAEERPSATGMLRWRSLRCALAAAGPANMRLVVPMIRTGLRDPDWRVRMAAVVAVGRLRLADLAADAMATRVPAAGASGLGSEDRRVLLALRQAAHDLAADLPPSAGPGEGMPVEIAARRRTYQRHLHAVIDGKAAADAGDRAALTVAALLASRPAGQAAYPTRWRSWLDREDG